MSDGGQEIGASALEALMGRAHETHGASSVKSNSEWTGTYRGQKGWQGWSNQKHEIGGPTWSPRQGLGL